MDKIIKITRGCPICNSDRGYYLDEIKGVTEEENCLPKQYTIVCCRDCGFTFADMEASQDDFDRYYAGLNIYSEAEGLRINKARYPQWYNFIYDSIRKHINKSAKVIDIGCGGGEFLFFLRERGHENLYGLDPSNASVLNLINKGIVGKVGSIFDDIPNGYEREFDLVISIAVIEHIYDLNKYVQQLIKYLKSDGYLLIIAPAVEGFKDYICPKPNYFNQEHINYFSKYSLDNLFGKYGIKRCNESAIFLNGHEKALYYLGQSNSNEYRPEDDEVSRKSIEFYLKQWRQKQSEQSYEIEKILLSDKRIVIFGCGQYTKQLLAQYPELMEKIKYFVDNNTTKQGTHMCNKEVYSLERLMADEEEITVCICSMVNKQDILEQLIDKKLNKKIIML